MGTQPPHATDPRPTAPPPLSPELRAHFAPLLEGTMVERCRMELLTLDATGGTMTMPVAGNTQPAGLLHGGATIALAESIASFADRKSTRLNSSHVAISYAVLRWKKKNLLSV